jgi:hypothetical protein
MGKRVKDRPGSEVVLYISLSLFHGCLYLSIYILENIIVYC